MPNHPGATRRGPAAQSANRALPSMMVMMRVTAAVIMLGPDHLNDVRTIGAFLISVVRLPFRRRERVQRRCGDHARCRGAAFWTRNCTVRTAHAPPGSETSMFGTVVAVERHVGSGNDGPAPHGSRARWIGFRTRGRDRRPSPSSAGLWRWAGCRTRRWRSGCPATRRRSGCRRRRSPRPSTGAVLDDRISLLARVAELLQILDGVKAGLPIGDGNVEIDVACRRRRTESPSKTRNSA